MTFPTLAKLKVEHCSTLLRKVSKKKNREERGEGEEIGKGRLGERGRKEEETSAIKPFQDGRRQGVGANFHTT